jgi:ribonuclease HI
LNRELWEDLLKLSRPHKIEWEWIKGHNGHPDNERCDQLARDAIKDCRKS